MSELSKLRMIPGLLGMDHIGIAVHSLEKSSAFFEKVFGAQFLHRETISEQNVEEILLDVNGLIIQLLAPISESGAIYDFLKTRGEGVQQIAFKVSNLEEACLAARLLGIRVVYPEARKGTRKSRINFLHPKDCLGILVELVEAN